MEKIGEYKGLPVYELTKPEYVCTKCYEFCARYFVIKDDLVQNDDGKNWKSLVFKNELVGLVSMDNSKVDSRLQARTYWSITPENKNLKPKTERVEAKPQVPVKEIDISDVDKFLRAPQSVDEYLKEMKEIMYYEVEKV